MLSIEVKSPDRKMAGRSITQTAINIRNCTTSVMQTAQRPPRNVYSMMMMPMTTIITSMAIMEPGKSVGAQILLSDAR